MSKRKRDPTFTTSEKEALLEIITSHFFIVESKKTDVASMKHKTEEWRKIATEFNATSCIYPRNWTVLKNCWENLKKRARQEQSLHNKHLGTGGVRPRKGIGDPILNRVLEIIHTRVSGFVKCFVLDGTQILGSANDAHDTVMSKDSLDADQSLSNSDIVIGESQSPVKLNELIETTSSDMITTDSKDWFQYTDSMPRERKNPALSPSSDVQQQPPDSQECHAPSTPPRSQTPSVTAFATSTSGRRPAQKENMKTSNLLKEKRKSILKANAHAEEEHRVKLKILRLQEEKEKEILKQEIVKTKQEEIKLRILELQLKKIID